MNFNNLITGNIGLIHLVFSIVALITGTLVLLKKKGSKTHKKIGYVYSISMVGLIITAFMLYNLFGSFGIFHWLAIVSTLTLAGGMIPILSKKPVDGYIALHWNFMYWSVMGLYAAFVSETIVRIPQVVVENNIPNHVFYSMTGIGTGIVMFLAVIIFFIKKKHWQQFEKREHGTSKPSLK